MPNTLFNALGGGNLPGPFCNVQQMIQQFNQFRQTFHGDPKQKVMEMLQSGAITQEQLNQAQQMARQFQQMLPK